MNLPIHRLKNWRGRWFGLLTLLWLGVMFWFSSQPATESSQLSGGVLKWLAEQTEGVIPRSIFLDPLAQTIIRKAAHFANYLMLGILVTLSGERCKTERILILGLLAAASDEVHQVFVPGRSGELRDVLLDLAGFAVGMVLVCVLQRLFRDQLPVDSKPVDDPAVHPGIKLRS
ncbi:MAG: VanZ family protein [Clostridia bacterium]|nr:VanZ family protein [Clostridia bacterium]